MQALCAKTRFSMTLRPRVLCETQGGNLAYVVGRLAFQPGRPFLVEHGGGVYLTHDFCGCVWAPNQDDSFRIVAVLDRTAEAEIICTDMMTAAG